MRIPTPLLLLACGLAIAAPVCAQSAAAPGEAAASAGAPAGASAADPVLQPGDLLRITVWRDTEMSGSFPISSDGTLLHPLYQRVQVGGLPVSEATERLRGFLRRYVNDSVNVAIEPLLRVTVAGEVRQPSLYPVPMATTVAQAVALAGGPTERGRFDHVAVIRGGQRTVVDLTRTGERGGGMPLMSGDQIVMGRRSNVLRDVIAPLGSFVAAVTAIINVATR